MVTRGLIAWFGLLALAIVNGAAREALLTPAFGATDAHAASSLTLSVLVLAFAWLTARWVGYRSLTDAWLVGALWLALTVAFEFLGGHYLFGTPWTILLADYNVVQGRIWPLVLLVTLVAPVLVQRARVGVK